MSHIRWKPEVLAVSVPSEPTHSNWLSLWLTPTMIGSRCDWLLILFPVADWTGKWLDLVDSSHPGVCDTSIPGYTTPLLHESALRKTSNQCVGSGRLCNAKTTIFVIKTIWHIWLFTHSISQNTKIRLIKMSEWLFSRVWSDRISIYKVSSSRVVKKSLRVIK